MKPRTESIVSKILVFSFAFGALFFAGWHLKGTDQDYPVNVPYVNGIITACGILFGIWTLVLSRRSKIYDSPNEFRNRFFNTTVKDFFFFCLLFLVMDVIALFFTAINNFSPFISLFMVTVTFIYTALFLALSLYAYFSELER